MFHGVLHSVLIHSRMQSPSNHEATIVSEAKTDSHARPDLCRCVIDCRRAQWPPTRYTAMMQVLMHRPCSNPAETLKQWEGLELARVWLRVACAA